MINIHVISSYNNGDFDIRVPENILVKKLKEKIEKTILLMSKNNDKIIYYGSHKLNDNKTLKDYGIKDGSIICFSISN